MIKTIGIALIFGILISCGETTEQKKDQNTDPGKAPTTAADKPLPSADYSSLFLNYECDLTAAEVAQIFNIPEADVVPIETKMPNRCDFEIKGFGKNARGGTAMMLGATPISKADGKKEIQSALKDKENNENIFGMDIELSETGDCYIRIMPHVGRVIIYNENYEGAFYFAYSPAGIYKRTEEEHAALGAKTIALANYLLKKHKK
ncbi:MAG: hypothetical protein WBN18_00200 [Flavobacteriaceae bacterium]